MMLNANEFFCSLRPFRLIKFNPHKEISEFLALMQIFVSGIYKIQN